MALGPIVDVAIGLILIYLLLGLIASASQEFVAAWLRLRGKYLRGAIADLVGNGDQTAPLFQKVVGHGLLQASAGSKLPSYLASRAFALAVVDSLGDGSQAPIFTQVERGIVSLPPGPTKESLRVLLQHAGGDTDALQTAIATWYDQSMDRLSGKYKRWCQHYSAIVGVVLAVVLNVNSLNIAYALWEDESLRANVTAAAQAYREQTQPPAPQPSPEVSAADQNLRANATVAAQAFGEQIGTLQAESSPEANAAQAVQTARAALDENIGKLFDLNLPIGWSDAEREKLEGWGLIIAVIGWLMTGLAVSIGAPFWFDLLKMALSVRAAGPKPARADGMKQN